MIGTDGFLIRSGEQLGALSLRHAMPTVFQTPEFANAGGLMSYGGNLRDAYRQVGVYAGRSSRAKNRPICRCSKQRRRS